MNKTEAIRKMLDGEVVVLRPHGDKYRYDDGVFEYFDTQKNDWSPAELFHIFPNSKEFSVFKEPERYEGVVWMQADPECPIDFYCLQGVLCGCCMEILKEGEEINNHKKYKVTIEEVVE